MQSMHPVYRHHSRVCGLWLGLPWCCKALLLLVTCQVFLGASAVAAALLKVKRQHDDIFKLSSRCRTYTAVLKVPL